MSKHHPITFKVTKLEDGRVSARNKIHYLHEDVEGDNKIDLEYSGQIIWSPEDPRGIWDSPDAADFNPTKLERALFEHTRRNFDIVPRPIALRVVYDIEGMEPSEKQLTVNDYIPDEEEEDEE